MKARIGLAVISAGALALGLLASGAAATAAPSAQKPSGKAIVRIDKGTATTKELSRGTYRIVVPKNVFIGWLGEVEGKGNQVGTFTPKALVAGWARLGHSNANPATATLTWVKKGTDSEKFRLASLRNPVLTADGKVAFTAKVEGKLPQDMRKFSINVNRAATAPRTDYPVDGPQIEIAEGVVIQGILTAYLEMLLKWLAGGQVSGAQGRSACDQEFEFSGAGTHNLAEDILCAGLLINDVSGTGYQGYVELTDTQVNVSTTYTPVDGTSTQGAQGRDATPEALKFAATILLVTNNT